MALSLSLATPSLQAQSGARPPSARELGPELALQRAHLFVDTAHYSDAARALVDFARRFPRHEQAPDALQDAAIFQLALGLHDDANTSVNLFERNYGRKRLVQSRQLRFAYALDAAERGDHKQAEKALAEWLRRYGQQAPPARIIEIHGLMGQTAAALGQTARADHLFEQVIALHGALVAKFPKGSLNDSELRQLGTALTRVGQAYYHRAMKRYDMVLANKLPRARGPITQKTMERHIVSHIRPWIQQRQKDMSEAEQTFLKVLQIQPEPPPNWVVKSAARVADMWLDTYQSLQAMPLPAMPANLRESYQSQLAQAASPLRGRARAALKTCISYGARYQSEQREVARCEQLLAKLDPTATVILDELIGALQLDRRRPLPAVLPDPREP